jgi:PAS domain S-box-containing protein
MKGKLLWGNKATIEIYGCSAESLKQRHFLNMVHPDDYNVANYILQEALKGAPQFYESQFLTESGEPRHAVFNSIPLVSENKTTGVLWFAREITEQKRALEHSLQADKLRALGQLASGVAHDFNNALTAILGRIQLLLERVEDKTICHSLRVVQTAAEDAAATVRRIQTFARQSPADDFQTVEISSLLRDSVEIMRTRWVNEARSRGIDYKVKLAADCGLFAKANASELREVFINLIGNALDAMPNGGELQIACAKANKSISISFADTGSGISEEIQKRIFEPFFSTKGANGTGLGLSVSYGIIEAHGGHISVASEPAQGTTFMIELPMTEKSENSQISIVQTSPGKEKFSVLVVDDEDFVREALAEMLRELEHEVVEAESGKVALQKLDSQHFDAVFTDLSMPEMDGWQFARKVREKNEKMKIVMVTGYGRGVQADSQDEYLLVDAIIGKPFNFQQLNEIIEQLQTEHYELQTTE